MLKGRSVSGGIAVGRAVVLRSGAGGAARIPVSPDSVEEECRKLHEAARAASEKLSALARGHAGGVGGEVSAILSAHALLAIDPSFLKPIEKLIRREHVSSAWCLLTIAEELRTRFAESKDPIFSERGNDVVDVARVI